MGYYDELLMKIDSLVKNSDFVAANKLILDELNMPYVPKDIEDKLNDILKNLPKEDNSRALSIEEIEKYLSLDKEKQLIAVDALNRLNLRDYLDICNKYLEGDGFINAKVLLIDSLINQDINEELHMINDGIEYNFIPKYVITPLESLGYKGALKILNDNYMKEPSKLELAKSLLYKECLMALPINYDENDANLLADKIIQYIDEAFA